MQRFFQHLCCLFLIAVFIPAEAHGQIDSGGIVNSASFRLKELPNSGIAQGAIFTIFSFEAQNIGPAEATPAGVLPLPTELGGVSVQITVSGVTVDCPLIFVSSTTAQAVLPSDTPVGTGELSLTFNGETFTEPITVAETAFGLFTLNQAGTGAAIAQNFDQGNAVNGLTQAINPNGIGILWGTGLGPVLGDPAAPCTGDGCKPDVNVEIYVGGVQATGVNFSRSGCCVGLDQLSFQVPAGVTGCYVPVVVVVNGIPSNYTTISIAEDGVVCSQPESFSATELEQLLSGGEVRIGSVNLTRISSRVQADEFDGESITDLASASFFAYQPDSFEIAAPPIDIVNRGACWVFTFRNEDAEFEEPIPPTPLDAGPAITLSGPKGMEELPKAVEGSYSASLFSGVGGDIPGIPDIPGLPGLGEPFLEPGDYTFTGPGGADVGPFDANRSLGELLTWTNRDDITAVSKSSGVTVTWTGGDPANDQVRIFGSSIVGINTEPAGGAFFCHADPATGSFTVGPEVLSLLPNSETVEGFPTGTLQVGTSSIPDRFTAEGLDIGWFTIQVMNSRTVAYE